MSNATLPKGFHSLNTIAHTIADGDKTRVFRGEGTIFLKVPGLKKLEKVICGQMEIPLTRTISYPVDLAFNQKQEEVPLVHLTHLPDGTPILLRSILSNDGIWQSEVDFAITGEWEEKVAYTPPPPPEPKKFTKGQR